MFLRKSDLSEATLKFRVEMFKAIQLFRSFNDWFANRVNLHRIVRSVEHYRTIIKMSKQTYGDNELKFIKLMMMQYTTLESENFVYPSPKLHLSPLKERKTHVRKLEIIYEEEEKENKKEFKPLQISRRTSPNELTF